MFIDDLATWLNAQTAVSAQVSTRIYRGRLPQGYTLPAIVYNRASKSKIERLSGAGTRRKELWSFQCFGDTAREAEQVANALDGVLDNYSGEMGDTTVSSVWFQSQFDSFDVETEEAYINADYVINYLT